VYHIAPVNILPRDRSWVVVVQGDGALAGACARTRNVDDGDGAIRGAQVAVICIVRVNRNSRSFGGAAGARELTKTGLARKGFEP
jgi:hypothetical protein